MVRADGSGNPQLTNAFDREGDGNADSGLTCMCDADDHFDAVVRAADGSPAGRILFRPNDRSIQWSSERRRARQPQGRCSTVGGRRVQASCTRQPGCSQRRRIDGRHLASWLATLRSTLAHRSPREVIAVWIGEPSRHRNVRRSRSRFRSKTAAPSKPSAQVWETCRR